MKLNLFLKMYNEIEKDFDILSEINSQIEDFGDRYDYEPKYLILDIMSFTQLKEAMGLSYEDDIYVYKHLKIAILGDSDYEIVEVI